MPLLFVLKGECIFRTLFSLFMIYNKKDEMLQHQFKLYKQEKCHVWSKGLIQ